MSTQRLQAAPPLDLAALRWECEPEFRPWPEPILLCRGEVIKRTPVKEITLHRHRGRIFYVKRYLHHKVPFRPLKYLFRTSPAGREWLLARQLGLLGVRTVKHCGLGERRSWRGLQEDILITEAFDGFPLTRRPEIDPARVLSFIESLHHQGVLQRDLHPANLLIGRDSEEVCLVDLHGVSVRRRLTRAERDLNLARLHAFFPLPVSERVDRLSRPIRQELLARRARRCLKENRNFHPLRRGGLQWQVRRKGEDRESGNLLENPEDFLRSGRPLKLGGRTTVVASSHLVLKKFNPRGRVRNLKDSLRASRARRAFHLNYHLELLGIAVPNVLATGDRRRFGILSESFLLNERIPGGVDLATRLRAGAVIDPPVAAKVARLVGQLHREGLSHRDLKLSNLLLDDQSRVWLVDLDGARYLRRVGERRARADVDRLLEDTFSFPGVGKENLHCFFRRYFRERRFGSREGRRQRYWPTLDEVKDSELECFDLARAEFPSRLVRIDQLIDLLQYVHRPEVVQQYRERMKKGDRFPPVSVLPLGGSYLLTDGHKRLSALRSLGSPLVFVEVWTFRRWIGDQVAQLGDYLQRTWQQLQNDYEEGELRAGFMRQFRTTMAHWKRIWMSLWELALARGQKKRPN